MSGQADFFTDSPPNTVLSIVMDSTISEMNMQMCKIFFRMKGIRRFLNSGGLMPAVFFVL